VHRRGRRPDAGWDRRRGGGRDRRLDGHRVPTEQAVPAVLVYRIATFWLPVLPGWLAFTLLTRDDVI
jgi:hypothetical protein